MTTTEALPHRPHIPMPLFDAEQPAQLERVKSNIAPLILAWFEGQSPGDEFHINELTRFVWRTAPNVAADSPRCVMAALKAEGKVHYRLIDRAQSLYCVTEPSEASND